MRDILAVTQANIAANYLFQLMFPRPLLEGGSGLFKVVLYRDAYLCHEQMSVTVGGRCFAGAAEIACEVLDLGEETLYAVSFVIVFSWDVDGLVTSYPGSKPRIKFVSLDGCEVVAAQQLTHSL
jgi:hypothetical protein